MTPIDKDRCKVIVDQLNQHLKNGNVIHDQGDWIHEGEFFISDTEKNYKVYLLSKSKRDQYTYLNWMFTNDKMDKDEADDIDRENQFDLDWFFKWAADIRIIPKDSMIKLMF